VKTRISGSMVQGSGCEPKLDRSREEWTRWIEQEIDKYKAKVLLQILLGIYR
jgi:hypothetical protein